MKLEKFKQRDPKRMGISIFTIACVLLIAGVFFYTSFASFETKQDFNIIEGTVGSNGDLYFAFYVDNEISSKMPGKGEGYVIDKEKTTCTKGASVEFNETEWSVKVINMTERNTKCTLYFESRYSESILNGTDPILEEPLIPVTIESDGTVKKADVKSAWYSYEEKNWANAIILKDESTANTYNVGDTIPEEKIESYFVWIPRYRYQLWDLGNYDSLTTIDASKVHEIPIIFGNYTTLDEREGECTTPMLSGESGNCQVGDYMTHPAFLSIPSIGFWMGKFETGYDGATSVKEAQQNVIDSSKVIIKPNTYIWTWVQSASAFYTSFGYKRELDSHMIKNTEWGAVAYLSQSKYGSATNIRLNNNSLLITGYSALNEPTCGVTGINEECNIIEAVLPGNNGEYSYRYNTSIGYLATTTGNITGIYDMAGGSHEYVLSFMKNGEGTILVGAKLPEYVTGFAGLTGNSGTVEGLDLPAGRYYDTYLYSSNVNNHTNRILGDATGEMGPFETPELSSRWMFGSWYGDRASGFSSPGAVTMARGGNLLNDYSIGTLSGIFAFGALEGAAIQDRGFRIILTPTGGSVFLYFVCFF